MSDDHDSITFAQRVRVVIGIIVGIALIYGYVLCIFGWIANDDVDDQDSQIESE